LPERVQTLNGSGSLGVTANRRRGKLGFGFAVLVILAFGARQVFAETAATDQRTVLCSLIESTAQHNALPVDFFARLIWQESRFRPEVLGPTTKSGEHAEGIAQFMPRTAAERQVLEPFNPANALPKSGEFLAELRAEFGNLGLAAAAYNAGPQRLRDYLAGLRDLPEETHNYVARITGRPVEAWVIAKDKLYPPAGNERGAMSCQEFLQSVERDQDGLQTPWQTKNVPSWCKALHRPNVSVCGPVHLMAPETKITISLPKRLSRVRLLRASLP
jgi:hypothetical protein